MKKLLGILVLGLLWCSNANAENCPDDMKVEYEKNKDNEIFKGIILIQNKFTEVLKSKGLKFEFVSSSRTTFTSESLLDSLGKRIPDFKTSQKHFKMLEEMLE